MIFVYSIKDSDGNIYVGHTCDPEYRIQRHKYDASAKHYLNENTDSWVSQIHEEFEGKSRSQKAFGREQYWIDTLQANNTYANGMQNPEVSSKNKGKNNPMAGVVRPTAWRKDQSQKMKETVVCPHCAKSGAKLTMLRWHFDNCKQKGI